MNVPFIFELLCSAEESNLMLAEQLCHSQGWHLPTLLQAAGYAQIGLDRLDKFLLTELDCFESGLEWLPELLPNSLLRIDCSRNRLRGLPTRLPERLEDLDCSYNQLRTLPLRPPANLYSLDCSGNQIEQLPPAYLQQLGQLRIEENPFYRFDLLKEHFKPYYSNWWIPKNDD